MLDIDPAERILSDLQVDPGSVQEVSDFLQIYLKHR